MDNTGFITIKGSSRGIVREEFEYKVPIEDAKQMMFLSRFAPVRKYRNVIIYDGLKWEVDTFLGNNKGLVLAEVELKEEKQKISLPPWIKKEVSGDPRFYNLYLAQHPFSTW